MKKIYLLFIVVFAFTQVSWGQITDESFESGSLPAGWTQNSTYINTGSAHDGTHKTGMNGTGDWIQTSLQTDPGLLSFYLRTSSDPDNWVLTVQISLDGTSFDDKLVVTEDGAGGSVTDTYAEFTIDLNLTGDYYIRWFLTSRSAGSAYLDYINLSQSSGSSILNPTAFSSSAGSTPNDIDLSWTRNGNSDNVMVAYSTSNTFGTPTDGSAYSIGNTIAGGGEVIYNGSGESYNHSSLTANTTYYYKAWSVDGSTNYSSGVITNATTTKAEPTDHLNTFVATANGTKIDLTWMDAVGGTEPDGYLIRANKTGIFIDPVDGTDEADVTDANGGVVNVSQGTETYSWTGLDASTQYYFKAWAYTNSGSHIDYKTDGTVPTANATTEAAVAVPDLIITEIMQNPSDVLDDKGEWFEIYNNEDSDIDINGYTIKDDGSDSHTIGSSVVISSKDFVILGINSDNATNGGLTIDYQYSSFILSNGDDEIVLVYSDGSTEIDRVNYDGGPNFPDPTGASMILSDLSKDNSVAANWTISTIREGLWLGVAGDDKGSPGDIGSEAVLPVELTSFTATVTDAGVMLNWTTATEVNNHGFEIQKLFTDEWEVIGFVEGHGNSNSPKEYSYFDATLVSNELSYRLKQVDNDGAFEYSNVVTVEANVLAKTELFQNHPNPFNPSTKISFAIAEAGKVSLSVYNVLGQKIANLVNQNMEKGNHTIDFRATNLSSGFYFYRLETSTFSKTMKMILLR